jgi:hypothetical protein
MSLTTDILIPLFRSKSAQLKKTTSYGILVIDSRSINMSSILLIIFNRKFLSAGILSLTMIAKSISLLFVTFPVAQLPNETLGENVANLALKYPEARIIMAHLGANSYRELKPIRKCKNVWTDYSGTLFRRDELDYAKETLGAERLLFGTDMDLASFLLKLGQLDDSNFTPGEREMVLYKNALTVFKH